MKITSYPFDLKLKHTFTISRSSRDVQAIVLVEVEHDGIVGYGEAAPSRRYGEDRETVQQFLSQLDLSRFEDPFRLEHILAYVESVKEGNTAAKAAVDI